MSARSEMKQLIKKVESQGFTVTRSGGGHWKVVAEDGRTTFLSFSPGTQGQHKTIKNLKQIGYQP